MKATAYIFLIFLSIQVSAQEYLIKIADMPPGNVDFEKAKLANCFTVEGPNNPKIIRFQLILYDRDLENSAMAYSDKFTDIQKEMITKTKRGSKLFVEKIRIKTDKGIIDLPSVTFKLNRFIFIDESLNLVTLGGINGGVLTKTAILDDPYIRLNNDTGTVIGFTLSANIPGFSYNLLSNSDKFTHQMIQFIKQLKIGSRFLISDAKIRTYDGTNVIANAVVFKLK